LKKFILILFPLLSLVAVFYLYKLQNPSQISNKNKTPLSFKDNKEQCPQCHMYLVGKKFTAQAIGDDFKTHFFDDVGCMILWVEEHKELKNVVLWVYTIDTKRYIQAQKAWYSIDENTPMEYGFGAYENKKESFIAFDEMKLRMLRGETLQNPKIRKKILSREI
jgi:hypothetical protein